MVIDVMWQFSKLNDHFVSFFLYVWSYLRKQKVLCWSFIFHENRRVWQNIEIFMPTWPTQKQTKKHWIKCWDTRRRYISSFVFFFIYLFVGFALSVQLKMCAYQQLRAHFQVCFLTTQCSRYNIIHLLVQYKLFCMKQNYVDFSYNRHAYCLLKLEPKWETFENFWIWVLLEGSAQIQV